VDARASHLRRGWYWGTQAFGEAMQRLGEKVIGKKAPQSRGYRANDLVRKHGKQQAEEWLRQGLSAAGMKTSEQQPIKGSDVRKVLLAELLWRRTVVSQEWQAMKLRMSSAANVSEQLRRLDKKAALGKVPGKMKQCLEQAHPTEP
jgi:putative transposase